ncbi:MAG: DUF748 domain-containing protein [Candidatus Omnitrophota bacterium]
MKRINKIIIWVLIIVFAAWVSLGIAIASYGKKMVLSLIEQNLKMSASLDRISLKLPFTIDLINLKAGDLFKAEKISVSPSILGFFAGKIVLNGLTLANPVISLEKNQDGSFNLPVLEQKGSQPPVFLTKLVINNGKFIFTDKKISPEGYKVILNKINVRISKVTLPLLSLNTKFVISLALIDPDANALGSMDASGWIDFGTKSMDAVLRIKDLNAVYFSPYYGDFISDKKLLSAKLNFSSLLKAKNNDLNVESSFKLSDLVYAKEEQPESGELNSLDFTRSTLDIFTDTEGNLNLDFIINTKLDNPGISISELKKVILKAAVKNLSSQSPDTLINKINNTLKQFKDFGKQMKNVFKDKGE